YFFTEPARRASQVAGEGERVRSLLGLKAEETVIEVRRYGDLKGEDFIGYLFPESFDLYDLEGLPLQKIPVKEIFQSAEEKDRFVKNRFPEAEFAGRFFITPKGYVTESVQYGFKSPIRIFVALTPDFEIGGVEVISHEEDPGLGDEITKPEFKNQFLGLNAKELQAIKVVKGPPPKNSKERLPKTIYGVTGATISSKAITEGVQKGVSQLRYRLKIALPKEVPDE
ncbi:MAG: FMN-binding protein, partial [bacterium]|nr:FMN-binding protein [bacterium]